MKKLICILSLSGVMGCTDLTENMYNDLNNTNFYTSAAEYDAAFMNQYAFLRSMSCWNVYYLQELTTDEACLPQKGRDGYDGGIYQRLHWHTWTTREEIIEGAWLELYKAVGFSNQILADMKAADNKILPAPTQRLFIAETRALRAYFYWMLCDLLGNVPIVESVSEENPATRSRKEVFSFVEQEINAVKELLLSHSDANSYGRFTREAALALLSRLYLNAEVYTGESRLDDCITVSRELLQCNFSLDNTWDAPFAWENENSKENIFVIPNDEVMSNEMSALFYRNIHWSQGSQWEWKNPNGGWNAICTERSFIEKYDIVNDRRCKYDPRNGYYGQFMWGPQFDQGGNPILGTNEFAGQQLDLTLDLPDMVNNKENAGARNIKYKVKIGAKGLANDFVIFRLAETYFNLAEATLRQSGTPDTEALAGINALRSRAGVPAYTAQTLTLDELYDEKGREMCYETARRTDMIRFGRFTLPMWDKNYTDNPRVTIFPIPYTAVSMNPNLKQHPEYENM